MPTVLRLQGCIWRIYTHDHPPPHAHVKVGDGIIVINLDTEGSLRRVTGMVNAAEITKVQTLTVQNLPLLLAARTSMHEVKDNDDR
jgi:hypothetical protein